MPRALAGANKRNQRYFGMKTHIGGNEFSGLVRHLAYAAVNVGDSAITRALLHGKEQAVLGDSGYIGSDERPQLEGCHAATTIAALRFIAKVIKNACDRKQVERWDACKDSMRSKVSPFRVIKRQFCYANVRYFCGAGQERQSSAHVVRAIERVEGAPATDAGIGCGAPGNRLRFANALRNRSTRTKSMDGAQVCRDALNRAVGVVCSKLFWMVWLRGETGSLERLRVLDGYKTR